MGLGNVRGRPRNAGSPHYGVDLLERDLPPLPRLDDYSEYDLDGQTTDLEDSELTEFVEFFTSAHRATTTAQPVAAPPASGSQRGRVRRATERVVRAAGARPVVQLPAGRRVRTMGSVVEQAPRRRAFRLPPVWILANLAILAALVIGFFPQIMTASAAAGCKWYSVKSGDTLWKLSQRYHVSISQLAKSNHIQNVNLIYIGQQMCIPMMPLASSNKAAPAPASRPPTYSAPSNVRAFVNYTLPYARKASAQTGWPVSVILAQWGLETGWRTKTYTGYNWGNCGGIPGFPLVGGINKPGSPSAFSYAYTPTQGVAEYVHVAHLSYYQRVAPAARSGGADAAARALGQSPWDWAHYTNKGSPGSSLINIMRVFNLYYYDTH